MMRKAFLISICMVMCFIPVMAQDFTSFFLQEYDTDTVFTRVTISPKMMEEILKSDVDKDEEILEIISNLKSMQVLSSATNGNVYYDNALQLAEKHAKRFQTLLSYDKEGESGQIVVRKKDGAVVEMVMLVVNGTQFAIINFTGDISPGVISTLASSMAQTHL